MKLSLRRQLTGALEEIDSELENILAENGYYWIKTVKDPDFWTLSFYCDGMFYLHGTDSSFDVNEVHEISSEKIKEPL